jgi:cytochrome c1
MTRTSGVLVALLLSAACNSSNAALTRRDVLAVGGDPARGVETIQYAGCGSCHYIPGVAGAHGMVAAPLTWFSRRTFIAGEVPNTPENLVLWLRFPQAIEPHTAMPSAGLNDRQARDVAAFLYTLR